MEDAKLCWPFWKISGALCFNLHMPLHGSILAFCIALQHINEGKLFCQLYLCLYILILITGDNVLQFEKSSDFFQILAVCSDPKNAPMQTSQ